MISIRYLFEFEYESLVKPVTKILTNQTPDNTSVLKKVINSKIVNNPNPIKLPPNMIGSRG